LSDARRPEWQLPRGVPRGAWEYARAQHIAEEYDEHFAVSPLFEFDEQVLAKHFVRPGLVVDLGAGTGRSLVPLARRGFCGLAVDLSPHMLRIVCEKAALENLRIWMLCANLVDLDCLRDACADYVMCLFSTIGMVHGRDNRRRVLEHAYRILKPDGLLVLHVHNFWYELFSWVGRRYLVRHFWECLTHRNLECGDKFFDYRGIPRMYLHTFGERELLRAVCQVGFHLQELIRLDARRQRSLRHPWFFGSLRANGWILVCRKGGDP